MKTDDEIIDIIGKDTPLPQRWGLKSKDNEACLISPKQLYEALRIKQEECDKESIVKDGVISLLKIEVQSLKEQLKSARLETLKEFKAQLEIEDLNYDVNKWLDSEIANAKKSIGFLATPKSDFEVEEKKG